MARVLIAASAVAELRALEPVVRRRRVVRRLSELDPLSHEHRLCAAGRCRMSVDGLRVLYLRRSDGALVIVSVASRDDVLDSGSGLSGD